MRGYSTPLSWLLSCIFLATLCRICPQINPTKEAIEQGKPMVGSKKSPSDRNQARRSVITWSENIRYHRGGAPDSKWRHPARFLLSFTSRLQCTPTTLGIL